MLTPEDRRAIEGLFSRLEEVEGRTPDRDPEAEALIRSEVARQPGSPYYMAQTILVQEHALKVAEQRIAELEDAQQSRRGGLFGGLFDDGRGRQNRAPVQQQAQQPASRNPWDRSNDGYNRGAGGGFLAGAAQTALGVAGGVLIGSAIGSMFGAGSAQAAEDTGADQDSGQDDTGDSGGDDGGGFDGGGDFDMGGEF